MPYPVPIPGSAQARLIEAAIRRFESEGRDAVNVMDVARDAGVTTGSLYHHFGSKEGLYVVIRDEMERRMTERMEGAAAAMGSAGRGAVTASLLVAFDAALRFGVARILFGWSSLSIMLPSYGLVLLLTMISDEKYVNIGWDSGGVTTGDITSPILIALGLGVAAAVGGAEGFSLIAMGSVWPIIAVLALGFFVNKTTPSARAAEK